MKSPENNPEHDPELDFAKLDAALRAHAIPVDGTIASSASAIPHPSTGPSWSGPRALVSPPMIAIVTVAALVGVPYLVPHLDRLRLLTPIPESASLFAGAPPAQPAATVGAAELKLETKDDSALRQPEDVELPAAAREIVPPPNAEQKPPREPIASTNS